MAPSWVVVAPRKGTWGSPTSSNDPEKHTGVAVDDVRGEEDCRAGRRFKRAPIGG